LHDGYGEVEPVMADGGAAADGHAGGGAVGKGITGGGGTGHGGAGHGGAGNGNGSAGTATWHVPCSTAEVGRARRALGRLLEQQGVGDDDGDAVLLVAHELLVNGVEHGRTAVRLTAAVRARSVWIEVRDGNAAPPQVRPFDPAAPRGRGMQMVAAIADRWGWYPDGAGKTVWAEVPVDGHLGPAPGPAA
jgi:anti-sigma regulatory factor (Ser/Thr protein kinase)